MAKKSKNGASRGFSNINLGEARKRRIKKYRAKKELEGTPLPYIEDAVNALCDKSLDLEGIPA